MENTTNILVEKCCIKSSHGKHMLDFPFFFFFSKCYLGAFTDNRTVLRLCNVPYKPSSFGVMGLTDSSVSSECFIWSIIDATLDSDDLCDAEDGWFDTVVPPGLLKMTPCESRAFPVSSNNVSSLTTPDFWSSKYFSTNFWHVDL